MPNVRTTALADVDKSFGLECLERSKDRPMIDLKLGGKLTRTRQPVTMRQGAKLNTAKNSAADYLDNSGVAGHEH